MRFPALTWDVPSWVSSFLPDEVYRYQSEEDRMRCAVELSRRNVEEKTGGPFGAAVFDMEDGTLVSIGVNLVVGLNASCAHAEIIAISMAQQALRSHTLRIPKKKYELVSSSEPCAMCLGAIPWSGVHRVICGARDEDIREIGFDEGQKPSNWKEVLAKHGISAESDVLREDARDVLRLYRDLGAVIYNG